MSGISEWAKEWRNFRKLLHNETNYTNTKYSQYARSAMEWMYYVWWFYDKSSDVPLGYQYQYFLKNNGTTYNTFSNATGFCPQIDWHNDDKSPEKMKPIDDIVKFINDDFIPSSEDEITPLKQWTKYRPSNIHIEENNTEDRYGDTAKKVDIYFGDELYMSCLVMDNDIYDDESRWLKGYCCRDSVLTHEYNVYRDDKNNNTVFIRNRYYEYNTNYEYFKSRCLPQYYKDESDRPLLFKCVRK